MPTDELALHTPDAVTDLRSRDYMRWLSCLHAEDGHALTAAKVYDMRWPTALNRDLIQKAAMAAGTTTDATWAGPLAPIMPLAEAFLAYSRPLSLIGRIPNLRSVPFNISIPLMTAPTTSGWVGQAAPKPVSAGAFTSVTLAIAKSADTIIVTDELIRLLTPGSEVALRAELAAAVAQFVDAQFCDPAVAGVAGVSPASVTNGVTPITPSGTTSAAAVADVDKLLAQFLTQNPNPTNLILLMTPAVARLLISATKIQTLTINGGTYGGVPVVTSGSVGATIIALDASAILYADAGVEIGMTRQATLQMDSAPDSPPTGATVEVSLWQYNLVGLRAERFINWKRSRPSAVALVSPTAYVAGT
jgi:hypothetical protein